MKELRFSFREPIYEFKFTFVITNDIKGWDKKFPDADKYPSTNTSDCCKAMHIGLPDKKECLIIIRPDSPDDHVKHEMGHAARYVMQFIGFQISYENDEPLAYYEDFIVREYNKRAKRLLKKAVDNKRKRA